MNLFNFFNFFSHAHHKRKQANAPLYAISFLFSFLRRGLQIRRNFSTTCTTLGTRGEKLQADAALCTRIAENGADAQPCLSDVYKNGTRAKRRQADVPLYAISSGRSMVEMLGVLAIIGVLSVGAIAGYSKAMMKYKLNKQAEQLDWLFNIIYQYKDQFVFNSSTSMIPLFTKLGLIDEGMIKPEYPEKIFDSFNNEIFINNNNSPTYNEIRCTINLPQADSTRTPICQNILNVLRAHSPYLLYINVAFRQDTASPSYTNLYYGDAYCSSKTTNCIRTISLDTIYNLCQLCDDTNTCRFNAIWRI